MIAIVAKVIRLHWIQFPLTEMRGLNDFDVNVLGDSRKLIASLASVSSGVTQTNSRVSDELFGNGDRNKVVGPAIKKWILSVSLVDFQSCLKTLIIF